MLTLHMDMKLSVFHLLKLIPTSRILSVRSQPNILNLSKVKVFKPLKFWNSRVENWTTKQLTSILLLILQSSSLFTTTQSSIKYYSWILLICPLLKSSKKCQRNKRWKTLFWKRFLNFFTIFTRKKWMETNFNVSAKDTLKTTSWSITLPGQLKEFNIVLMWDLIQELFKKLHSDNYKQFLLITIDWMSSKKCSSLISKNLKKVS